jgi:hypothetical protein
LASNAEATAGDHQLRAVPFASKTRPLLSKPCVTSCPIIQPSAPKVRTREASGPKRPHRGALKVARSRCRHEDSPVRDHHQAAKRRPKTLVLPELSELIGSIAEHGERSAGWSAALVGEAFASVMIASRAALFASSTSSKVRL